MKFGRIFVTAVAALVTLGSVACSKEKQSEKDKKAARIAQNKALIAEGESLLGQADVLRKDLEDSYKVIIQDTPIANGLKSTLDHKTLGKDYNWARLTLAERQFVKEKLASLMTIYTRIIEIDVKKGVYVDFLQRIRDRKAATESHQISLGLYERLRGELYNSPTAGTGPIYKSID